MVGELFFNGKDAYLTWGVIMGKGCYASLICPGSPKSYISNESRTNHGKDYICDDGARIDERKFTLSLSIMATSRTDLYAKISSFSQEVLELGAFDVWTKYQSAVHYHCVYDGFSQLTEFNGRLATFTLSLIEFNPKNRVPINYATFSIPEKTIYFKYALDATTSVNFIDVALDVYQGCAINSGLMKLDMSQEYDDFVADSGKDLYDLEITSTGSIYMFNTKIVTDA